MFDVYWQFKVENKNRASIRNRKTPECLFSVTNFTFNRERNWTFDQGGLGVCGRIRRMAPPLEQKSLM